MDNLRGLLGIRRMDRVQNAWIRELCGVMKGLVKVFSIGLDILKWRMIGCQKGVCRQVCGLIAEEVD